MTHTQEDLEMLAMTFYGKPYSKLDKVKQTNIRLNADMLWYNVGKASKE